MPDVVLGRRGIFAVAVVASACRLRIKSAEASSMSCETAWRRGQHLPAKPFELGTLVKVGPPFCMVTQVLRRRFLIGSSLVALMLSMPLDEGMSRDGVASNWQIPVSTLPVGKIEVASFSGFSSPASSIFLASN